MDWLERTYRRLGSRYVSLSGLALGAGLIFVVAPATGFFAAVYSGLSVGEYLIALSTACAVAVLSALIALAVLRRRIQAVRRWAGGERGAELEAEAAEAAFSLPRLLVCWAGGLALLLAAPVSVAAIAGQSGHTELLDFVELSIGGFLTLFLAGTLGYFVLTLIAQPIRAEMTQTASEEGSSVSLAMTLWAGVLASSFAASTMVGTLDVRREADGAGALLPGYAIALGATLIIALAVLPVLAGTVVTPLRRLIRGTRAVRSGDLDASVPVTSHDELGELAGSFNEMVDGLRDASEQLRASRARIVAAGDESRRRVERDLHDGAQQNLVMLNLKLGLLQRALETDPEAAAAMVDEAHAELERALAELRDLAHGIYPAVLTSDGLPGALAEVVEGAPIEASLDCDGAGRYAPELEAAVYFCCLEALQNAAKHAGEESRATVTLSDADGELRFEVSDDGVGFDPAAVNGSAGLQNMADRIGALGGELRVDSTPGSGTTIAGLVPVEARSRE